VRRTLLTTTLLSTLALPAETIPGPVNAHVISVYDGDTFTVDAVPWPG
jgi:endonuclease YncB( thermonuclease family)